MLPTQHHRAQSEEPLSSELDAWLRGLVAYLIRYVVFPSLHEAVACSLWVVHAYWVDLFEVSPILIISSAEKRSGKSRLLDCLNLLVPNPYPCVMPSEAAVYTIMSERPRPTLLLDEADAIFQWRSAERYDGLRAILNSGWRRGAPVIRVNMEGKKRVVERFDAYGAKAIAGIGDLPDTITDRGIVIRMKRKARHEAAARFRIKVAELEAAYLREFGSIDVPIVTDVPVPDELNDRAADIWEPLLAIADAAGGEWPKRARAAALALSLDSDSAITHRIRLLLDIRDAFTDLEADHLPTVDLLRVLHEIPESPWARWYGHPMTPHALARQLTPFGIGPRQTRQGAATERGYLRADFEDAWARYLPSENGTSGTSGTREESDER